MTNRRNDVVISCFFHRSLRVGRPVTLDRIFNRISVNRFKSLTGFEDRFKNETDSKNRFKTLTGFKNRLHFLTDFRNRLQLLTDY